MATQIGQAGWINAQFQVRETIVTTVLNKVSQLCDSVGSRVALIISLVFQGGASYVGLNPGMATKQGYDPTASNNSRLNLNIQDHPGLVSKAWYVFGGVAGNIFQVIEVLEVPLYAAEEQSYGAPVT